MRCHIAGSQNTDADKPVRFPVQQPVGQRRTPQPQGAGEEAFIPAQRRREQAFHLRHGGRRNREVESVGSGIDRDVGIASIKFDAGQ